MKKKKRLIEEVDKAWRIASLIKEVGPATTPIPVQQGQRAPQSTPPAQQGQGAPQPPKQGQPVQNQVQINPQQAQAAMDKAMAELTKELPAILQNFTATAGDKDKQLEVPGQKNQQPVAQTVQESKYINELKFNEEKFNSHFKELNEAGVFGLVASAPAIMQLGGKLLQKLGSKTNPNFIQKFGGVVAKAGESLHHKYIGVLEKIVSPLMKNATPQAKHQAAEAMFMVLVAGLFASGLTHPGALTGVKGTELAQYVKKIAPQVMSSMGFA